MKQIQLLLLGAILVVLGFIARDLHRLAWEFGPLGAVSNGILGAALKAPETREQRNLRLQREQRELLDDMDAQLKTPWHPKDRPVKKTSANPPSSAAPAHQ